MTLPVPLLAAGLATLAAAPGLLASLHLLQLKEWRWDRLRVHLQREGWLRPVFGIVRPTVVAICLLASIVAPRAGILGGLFVLAALGPIQLLRGRLAHPVWTRKAMIVAGISALLTAVAGSLAIVADPWGRALLALTLLHPVLATFGLWLFLPVDTMLKARIMRRAEFARLRHAMTVIGVAGSVGKTTTKELLQCLLAPLGSVATPAHVNSELGVAQWLLATLRGSPPPILIVEMGAYRRGEIARLCRIVHPSMGLITALGRDHLGLFGSADAIRSANAELIHFLPAEGFAALLADDGALPVLTKAARCPVTTVGCGGQAELRATDVRDTDDGIAFAIEGTIITIPLRGEHNVSNALLAVAIARKLGVSLADCAQRLRGFQPIANTFAVRGEAGCLVLDDTYNSSPESFRAAIAWAKSRGEPAKVLLTSGVMELGKEHDRILAELGTAARTVFQRVVFTTDAGRESFAQGAGMPVERLGSATQRIAPGTLLLCVGRMPPSALRALLPSAH